MTVYCILLSFIINQKHVKRNLYFEKKSIVSPYIAVISIRFKYLRCGIIMLE